MTTKNKPVGSAGDEIFKIAKKILIWILKKYIIYHLE